MVGAGSYSWTTEGRAIAEISGDQRRLERVSHHRRMEVKIQGPAL